MIHIPILIYTITTIIKLIHMKLPILKCKKCGHEWTPRTDDVRVCPKCRSLRWDRDDKQ